MRRNLASLAKGGFHVFPFHITRTVMATALHTPACVSARRANMSTRDRKDCCLARQHRVFKIGGRADWFGGCLLRGSSKSEIALAACLVGVAGGAYAVGTIVGFWTAGQPAVGAEGTKPRQAVAALGRIEADARVIEVWIDLDDGAAAERLTNLTVDVVVDTFEHNPPLAHSGSPCRYCSHGGV